MIVFEWHSESLTRHTQITPSYRMTQNVRRFMRLHCGEDFKFDRAFIAWVKSGAPKSLGDVVDEWLRLHS